jgi:hypothetical protein
MVVILGSLLTPFWMEAPGKDWEIGSKFKLPDQVKIILIPYILSEKIEYFHCVHTKNIDHEICEICEL